MQDVAASWPRAAGVWLILGIGLIGLPVEASGLLRNLSGVSLVGLALLFILGRRTF
jgi:hypothetical protein